MCAPQWNRGLVGGIVKDVKRLAVLAVLAVAGCGGSDAPAERAADARPCDPAAVNRTPPPGPRGLGAEVAWIGGEPRSAGLVGFLVYWPERWHDVGSARVVTGGVMPEGWTTKTMWAFVNRDDKHSGDSELVIEGRNLDRPGTWRESFAAISYEGQNGAPSYASIIDLPDPGCWRLTLSTGDLRATVDISAVRAPP
jgi:hypothetical protein